MTTKARKKADGNHGGGQENAVAGKCGPVSEAERRRERLEYERESLKNRGAGMPWAKIPRDANRIENIQRTFDRLFLPAIKHLLALPKKQIAAELLDFALGLYHQGFIDGSVYMNDPRCGNTGPRRTKETKTRRASDEQKDRWIEIYRAVREQWPGWSQADVIAETIKRVHKGQGKHIGISESTLREWFRRRGIKMK